MNYQPSLPRPRADIYNQNKHSLLWSFSLEQPTSDRSCHSLSSFKQKLPVQPHRMDCNTKLLGRERNRQTEKERQRPSFFQVICFAIIVIGYLRPSFHSHLVLPDFPTAWGLFVLILILILWGRDGLVIVLMG